MLSYIKTAKFTLWIVYLFMALLAVAAVSLPWLVIWYVETMGRSPDLATVVMLTCYPCVPFAVMALLSARKLLKCILDGRYRCPQTVTLIHRICLCCLFAGLIMFAAGFFYMPFFIAGTAALSCSLLLRLTADLFKTMLKSEPTKEE